MALCTKRGSTALIPHGASAAVGNTEAVIAKLNRNIEMLLKPVNHDPNRLDRDTKALYKDMVARRNSVMRHELAMMPVPVESRAVPGADARQLGKLTRSTIAAVEELESEVKQVAVHLDGKPVTGESIQQFLSFGRVVCALCGVGAAQVGSAPLASIAVPADAALWAPENAAAITGYILFGAGLVNLLGPKFGEIADRLGDFRLLIVLSAVVIFAGRLGMWGAAFVRTKFSLAVYAFAYAVQSLGVGMQGVAYFSLAGSLGTLRPSAAGVYSSVLILFSSLGMLIGFAVTAFVNVTETDHTFYALAALSEFMVLPPILCLPAEIWTPQKILAAVHSEPSHEDAERRRPSTLQTLKELCSPRYRPFMFVVYNQILYISTIGVFNQIGLYYIEDAVAGEDGQTYFSTAQVVANLVSTCALLPAGPILDRLGAFNVTIALSLVNVLVFVCFPHVSKEAWMTVLISTEFVCLMIIQAGAVQLISLTAPDQRNFARDMGIGIAAQAIGNIVPTTYCGSLLQALTPANMSLPFEGSSRAEYSPRAYTTTFEMQAGICILAALTAWVARALLSNNSKDRLIV